MSLDINKKKMKYGTYAIVISAIVIAVAVAVNVLFGVLAKRTNLDIDLSAKSQCHGCYLTCKLHPFFKVIIDMCLIGYGETLKMNAQQITAKVVIQSVAIER